MGGGGGLLQGPGWQQVDSTALGGREYGICSQLLAPRAALTAGVCHGAGACPIRMGLVGRGRRWRVATGTRMRPNKWNAKILEKSLECENQLAYLGGDGFEGHIRNFGRESQVVSRWGLGNGCSRYIFQ